MTIDVVCKNDDGGIFLTNPFFSCEKIVIVCFLFFCFLVTPPL